MSIDADTRDMLAKLIGMLGSEHDGECLNAARLLRRRMQSAGVSFGDLSNIIRSGQGGSTRVIYQEKRATPNPATDLVKRILAATNEGKTLTFNERRFLKMLLLKHNMTDGNYELTTPQCNWLTLLADRYLKPKPKPKPKPRPLGEDDLEDLGLGEKPEAAQDDYAEAAAAAQARAQGSASFKPDPKKQWKRGQRMPGNGDDFDDYEEPPF